MSKKIINIIIFVIAGIGCLLSLWFSLGFDDNKRDLYYEINNIQEFNKPMLADFGAVTIATLPDFVSAKNTEYQSLMADIKSKQHQKDIFYTYLVELKDLNENSFLEYKAQFPERSKILFADSKFKEDFVNGFTSLKDYESLHKYILSLEKKYEVVKQDYLKEKNYIRAYANLLKRAGDINNVVSESKKTNDLNILQKDVKKAVSDGGLLNLSIIFVYLIFFIALALVLIFSIIGIATSIKSSYQVLLGAVLLVVVLVVGYFVASPELSKSAIVMGHTASEVKWIESGIILFYVLLIGAILSIFITPLINKFKKI